MPINPVQFAHNVCDEFLRYVFSAFPLSDPDLRAQFRQPVERLSITRHPTGEGAIHRASRVADLDARGLSLLEARKPP